LAIRAGEGNLAIADAHFGTWVRNRQSLAAYRLLITPQRDWMPEVIVLWGPTGTGKSRWARENMPDAFWLTRHNNGNQYWDGYEGHADVVIDEFYGWLPRGVMQSLCDRYPMQLRTLGGSVACLVRRICIISNQHFSLWWPRMGLGPLIRRFTDVRYIDYSEEMPCVECGQHPHEAQCHFEPPTNAPPGASVGGGRRPPSSAAATSPAVRNASSSSTVEGDYGWQGYYAPGSGLGPGGSLF